MKYSLDTSALVNGWHKYYPPDIFSEVWSDIDNLSHTGRLLATEEVLHELEKEDDDVHAWAKERSHIFVPIDEQIQLIVREILNDHPRLVDNRKQRSGADPFIIALAMIEKATVVTFESPSNSISKPKIPDICFNLDLPCFTLLGLIREEGWRYPR